MKNKLDILIIDDSNNHVEECINILKKDYLVNYRQIVSKQEFLDAITEKKWHIIISEIELPNLTSTTALEILKNKNLQIPFIILTNRTSIDLIVEQIKNGASNYLLMKNINDLGKLVSDEITKSAKKEPVKENFKYFAENAQDIIYRMSLPDGKYEYVSPAAELITGYTPEEFYNNPILIKKLFTHEWQEYFDVQWENLLKGNMPKIYEYQILHKSGELRWLNQRNILIKDKDKNPIAIEGIITDITKQKQIEEELRARELELSNLDESSPGMMGTFYQKPDGSICIPYASNQIENLYGLTADEVKDNANILLARNHPDDIERVKKSIEESAKNMTPWKCEFRVNHPKRGIVWLEGSTNPKPHPKGGIIWYGFIHDITLRKKAEEELKIREKHSQSLLRLSLQLEKANTFDDVADAALNEVKHILNYNNLWIYSLSSDGEYATVLSSKGTQSKKILNEKKATILNVKGDSMLEEIFQTSTIVTVENAELDERTNKEIVALLGNKTIINVPILLSERMLGSVGTGTFGDEGIHVPTLAEQEYLRGMANHLAFSITRIQLNEERKRTDKDLHSLNRQLRAISSCNQSLLRIEDEQNLINEVCRIICDEAGYRLAWVGYAENDDAKSIKPVAWAGYNSGYIESVKLSWDENLLHGQGPAGKVIRSGEIVYAQDFSIDKQMEPWREKALERGYQSGIALPLKDQKLKVFGVLLIYSEEKNSITPDEIKLIEELANDLAFGIITLRQKIIQKKIEKELYESKEQYRIITENTADTIGVFSLDFKPTYISPSVFNLRGFTVEEALKQTIDQILTPNSINKIRIILNDQLKLENENKSASSNVILELEEYCKDGRIISVEVSASFLRDDNGKPISILTVTRDITARKLAEMELVKLYAAIEQSSATIVITDVNGIIEYVNPKFNELTGYTVDEVKGKNPRILNSGNHSKEFYSNMWKTITTGNDWHGEIQNKKKNGELFWENAVISPIKNNLGTITHFVAVKENISEKKKIMHELVEAKEQAEEMNKVKSIFFANMSHELRTPFVGIMGYADLLSQTLTDPEEKEMAVGLLNTSKRMKDTLTKILNLSKLEFNEVEFNPKDIEVSELLDIVYKEYIVAAERKNLTLELIKHFDKLIINTDESLLLEVLNNLISNAIIYTNEGSISIIAEKIERENNDGLKIIIKDTGIGIPKEKQSVIWEEFRQVSEGTTRNYQGTGLGLAIVKKYIQLLGGKIVLESKKGKGTTFIIEL